MILEFFSSRGIRHFIISFWITSALVFLAVPSVVGFTEDLNWKLSGRTHQKIRSAAVAKPQQIAPVKSTAESVSSDIEFQPGDFSGDYELSVENPVIKTRNSRLQTKRRVGKLRTRNFDFDDYGEEGRRYESEQPPLAWPEKRRYKHINQKVGLNYRAPGQQIQERVSLPGTRFATDDRQAEFDEPPSDHPDSAAHDQQGTSDEVRKLKTEIEKLEHEKKGRTTTDDHNVTVNANLTLHLKWKQYKNMTDVDSMELKYEVTGKDSLTVEVIFFMLIPSLLLILMIYLAITLYWTKCWFWKTVPPDRFYLFERYEIEQDEDPSDLAPLLKTPLQALHDAEIYEQSHPKTVTARPMSGDESGPDVEPRRSRRKTRDQHATANDEYGLTKYDVDGGRHKRSARTTSHDRSEHESTDQDDRDRRRTKTRG